MQFAELAFPTALMPAEAPAMYIYLYKITNQINQKEYIGVHQTNDLYDGYMGSGVGIKRAIKKYGKANFSIEILEFFSNKDDAYRAESVLVNEDYVRDDRTYNLTTGGKIPPNKKGIKLSELHKEKIQNFRNSEAGKGSASKGGKTVWRTRVGWSKEEVEKRVATRRSRNSYSHDMAECHTKEAINKRNKTRLERGVKYNVSSCNSAVAIFKRERTKLEKIIRRIIRHYASPFTLEVLKSAQKEKVTSLRGSTIKKYFSDEDILRISYDELQARSSSEHHT